MQNDQIYSELFNLVRTKDDFSLIKAQLDLLESGLYETKGNTFDYVLKNKISSSLSGLILKLIKTEKKENVIEKIRQELEGVKFLKVTLAIDPSEKFIESMADWLNKMNSRNIALDIEVDQSIIGGVIVEFEGKYFDASLRSKLDLVLKNYV